jgi:sucrose-6-phosphatase
MSKFMFVTDLDNTLVNHNTSNDRDLKTLNKLLTQYRTEFGAKIVYATGRSPKLYKELAAEKQLITPDALVLSVGTEIYLDGSNTSDKSWAEILQAGWNREKVIEITSGIAELQPQPDSEQRTFKASFFLEKGDSEKILQKLDTELQKCGLNIKLIYSSEIDLDIIPQNSDKGQAMKFLRQQWKFVAERTVVCGDSGNDIALFASGDERGVIVGNARPELLEWHNENPTENRYLAKNTCSAGILEGLKHFGFL